MTAMGIKERVYNNTGLTSNTRPQALLNNPAATTDHLDQQRHRGRLSCLT